MARKQFTEKQMIQVVQEVNDGATVKATRSLLRIKLTKQFSLLDIQKVYWHSCNV